MTAPAWATDKNGAKDRSSPPLKSTREASHRSANKTRSRTGTANGSLPELEQHRVVPGETLSHVALRYGTTVEALRAQNGLEETQPIRSGQILLVPNPKPREPVIPEEPRHATANPSWRPYLKSPKQKGYLDVSTRVSHFAGAAVDSKGRLSSNAVHALNELLGAGGAHPPLPERLIRLLTQVSDAFGGRAIRVVSGYRTNSYFQDSKHKASSAVDFILVGVPNAILCDYLRGFEDVGVGYYPNSSFVHLDVRDHSAYWVDYAGPGEPPRATPNAPSAPRAVDRQLLAELDGMLKQVHGALQRH